VKVLLKTVLNVNQKEKIPQLVNVKPDNMPTTGLTIVKIVNGNVNTVSKNPITVPSVKETESKNQNVNVHQVLLKVTTTNHSTSVQTVLINVLPVKLISNYVPNVQKTEFTNQSVHVKWDISTLTDKLIVQNVTINVNLVLTNTISVSNVSQV